MGFLKKECPGCHCIRKKSDFRFKEPGYKRKRSYYCKSCRDEDNKISNMQNSPELSIHYSFNHDCLKYLEKRFSDCRWFIRYTKSLDRMSDSDIKYWEFHGENSIVGMYIIARASHVKILTKGDIYWVANGWHSWCPIKLFITPLKTRVPAEVRLYAKQKNVEIVRLNKNYNMEIDKRSKEEIEKEATYIPPLEEEISDELLTTITNRKCPIHSDNLYDTRHNGIWFYCPKCKKQYHTRWIL